MYPLSQHWNRHRSWWGQLISVIKYISFGYFKRHHCFYPQWSNYSKSHGVAAQLYVTISFVKFWLPVLFILLDCEFRYIWCVFPGYLMVREPVNIYIFGFFRFSQLQEKQYNYYPLKINFNFGFQRNYAMMQPSSSS